MTTGNRETDELIALLRERTLVADHVEAPVGVPVAEWLDSLSRLELVEAIEARWGVDLEEMLLGPAARELDIEAVAELLTPEHRSLPGEPP